MEEIINKIRSYSIDHKAQKHLCVFQINSIYLVFFVKVVHNLSQTMFEEKSILKKKIISC